MVFKNKVKNMQAAAYNEARTICNPRPLNHILAVALVLLNFRLDLLLIVLFKILRKKE